ncbi:hypothetical protein [Streptomyces sp. AC495_CC817]|uniref:hypothetical protein n=1 Tax=Streptomyces sp. AC495_CC817 TaxID=2823900 RepID=UPI001C25C9A7|nr:hypothetical protein [Streptomyces sp. AC495_CC817]
MIGTVVTPLNIDVTTSMVAVVTVLAVLVVSLATLARPSRATITWGAAFALGMLGAYLWLGGYELDDPHLRAGASGILLDFEPLVWLGLRMYAGRRVRWTPTVAFMLVCPAALVLTAGTVAYPAVFRVSFLAGSVFAGLIVLELLRLHRVPRDITMPLMLASGVFVVLAIVAAASVLFAGGLTSTQQLTVLRGVNSVGTLVMSTCAAFTLVLLVRVGAPGPADDGGAMGRVRHRLRRAQAQNDQGWSLLDVRLDDPEVLREASSTAAFALISERFHDDIEASLPAIADVHRIDDGRALVLISGAEEVVRHHIRSMLGRISTIDRDEQVSRIRVSASVGWASTAVCGHDLDVLAASAAEAAARAEADGGDRWARAASATSPTTLER